MQPIKTVDVETIMSEFSTNLVSSALIVKTLINKRKNQSALDNVVFISSNISNRGAKAFGIYSATKSGLDGLMRSLSVELAPKVRVNSVLPGGIPTEMTKAIYEENGNSKEYLYPLGYGKPHYIADTVEFLLSNKSKWITGQQIVVDGGRTINITE
jgi:NAD(P)-dependent dehydrogenase (short-subunit alcohol dehydrogenase family)